jgi:hypothetical protein
LGVIRCQASGSRQHRTGTARGLAHCYPYMFQQSAKSAIPPAVAYRHRSRCGTGDHGAAIRQAVGSMLASDCLLFRANCEPNATERIPQRPPAGCHGAYSGRNPRADSCTSEAGHRYRSGSGRTERRLLAPGHAEPGTIRHVTAPLTRPVVAASWHPAIRQHYRGEFGTATPSAPLPAAKSGQDAVSIRPVIAVSWRRDYAAQSGHQRVSAPRSQRVGAPLPAT